MVSREEAVLTEIESEILGTRFGLRWVILSLIFFHVAALLFYVILLMRGNRPAKKVVEKEH